MHKQPSGTFVALCLSCFVATDALSEEKQTEQGISSSKKTYTTEIKPKLSRRCAIYSGVCPMHKRAEVGAYCLCQTPSGPIYGLVIP
jgi:hypothetical protein